MAMSAGPSPFAPLLDGFLASPPTSGLSVEVGSDGLDDVDRAHLARALAEAHRGVGRTAPNPPVGALVARGAEVLATGFHARAGERHAEVVALDEVQGEPLVRSRGATLYVTLEPCVHHGRTPPCADRVIAEGVARVVIGAVDPNPRVHEKGIAALRAAGIRVDVAGGELGARCRALIAPFTRAVRGGRPWVTLKIAASLDGRVAASGGASRWITGERARGVVHALRNTVDAVVVGSGTVLADDPRLTVRLPELDARAIRDPRRVVIDGALRTSPHAAVYSSCAGARPLVVHGRAPADRAAAFDAAGVERLERAEPGAAEGRVDLEGALRALAPAALAVLVEAGPGLATALLKRQLVDEIWWFAAPFVLGADAVPAIGPLDHAAPADAPRWMPVHRAVLDDDTLLVLRPSPPAT